MDFQLDALQIKGKIMMRILLLFLTFTFAGELEVEGDLKVSGNIDAQNNPITNVGTPVLDTDATNLSTVRSMLGMKPDRIYSFKRYDNEDFFLTVPEGKLWIINMFHKQDIKINGTHYFVSTEKFSILPGWTLEPYHTDRFFLNIYEYSISSSGTDQGIDYIVP